MGRPKIDFSARVVNNRIRDASLDEARAMYEAEIGGARRPSVLTRIIGRINRLSGKAAHEEVSRLREGRVEK